jgi:UDP-N-acetylmuramyl pentapeptide phosphotransferase/UDP-N-acetylglucosamine-1-phosphate transferase
MILNIVAVGALCGGLGAVATAVARRVLSANGILDRPNERSLHGKPVVRGAGISMSVVWVGVALVASLSLSRPDGSLALVAMAGCLSVLGLVDDVRHLSPLLRLAIELGVCAAAMSAGLASEVVTLPGGLALHLGGAAVPLWTLWGVLVINLFNFMDGIDGLAASQTLISAVVIGIVGLALHLTLVTVLGVALAGVAAGFLPFNWNPARCFMGDAGSYFCGGTLAGIWLLGQKEGVSLLVLGFPAIGFFLDALITLCIRTMRGQRPWRAHRSHLYQRLVMRGWPQASVTLSYAVLAVALSVLDISQFVRLR